jgi:hypothetical protein
MQKNSDFRFERRGERRYKKKSLIFNFLHIFLHTGTRIQGRKTYEEKCVKVKD